MIDVSKIEGYENMTAEEKVVALENYTIEEPQNVDVTKLKSALNKASSEAAEYKKQLRAQMSEADREKAEREEREKALSEELASLKHDKVVAEYVSQYQALGYDIDLAKSTAEAMANGDMPTVFANQKTFSENMTAKLKAEYIDKQPSLSKGGVPEAKSKEDLSADAFRKAVGLV